MPNPLVDQGVLNRIRGSVLIPSVPTLNVTAPFLAREAIRLALGGGSTNYIKTLTGAARSQEPVMEASVTVHLLRTQPLGDVYKKRMERDSFLGDVTVRGDSAKQSPYAFFNCSIADVGEQSFAGDDPVYRVTISGYYNINSAMFDG